MLEHLPKHRLAHLAAGAISITAVLAGCGGSQQTARADQRWAQSVCTHVLAWQTKIHHDETSLNLNVGPHARVQDAITATHRLATELTGIGLPVSQHNVRQRRQIRRLMRNIRAQAGTIADAATKLQNGDLTSAGALIDNSNQDAKIAAQLIEQLQHAGSMDLAIAALETKACRKLADIPI
jgi:hypothetical protein